MLGGLSGAGITVSLINIKQSILVGLASVWVVLSAMTIYAWKDIPFSSATWPFVKSVLSVSGPLLLPLILLGFYIYQCLWFNMDYISQGLVPDAWYTFSYFVVATLAINIVSIIQYMKLKTDGWYALSMLASTLLLVFVAISKVICTYYRTDGFSSFVSSMSL